MKKLMIMLASIAVAVVAQAATMDWQVGYSYQPGADTDEGPFAEGWVLAVFDAGVAETADAAAITALINADATAALAKAADYGLGGEWGDLSGTATFIGEAGDMLNAYLVLFNSDDVATATKFYITEVSTAEVLDKGLVGKFKFGEGSDMDLLDTADAANWTSITASGTTPGGDVPEPTSGLLLLLGVAGLALKRKRA